VKFYQQLFTRVIATQFLFGSCKIT